MLKRRRLGRTGVSVSLIGFGGIPIMRVRHEDAVDVVGQALECGIDLFDTARGYGDSEKKIGDGLRAHGAHVFLASKSPRRDGRGLRVDFEESLCQLSADSIDLYQLHCVNALETYDACMAPGGAYEALDDLKREGRIRFLGITSHNLEILKRAILSDRFDTIQVLYSFVEDDARTQIIPLAVERDIGVIAMKPLGGGCIERCDLALRYVVSTPGIVALPGMATSEEVKRNAETAADLRVLDEAELKEIARIRDEIGKTFCRRCEYCQPCPNDVPISVMLHIESVRKRIGDAFMKTDMYKDILDKADRCDECGQCEDKCPFGLPVRDLIKESRLALSRILG